MNAFSRVTVYGETIFRPCFDASHLLPQTRALSPILSCINLVFNFRHYAWHQNRGSSLLGKHGTNFITYFDANHLSPTFNSCLDARSDIVRHSSLVALQNKRLSFTKNK